MVDDGPVEPLLTLHHDVGETGHADADADAERALVGLLVRRYEHNPGADDAVGDQRWSRSNSSRTRCPRAGELAML